MFDVCRRIGIDDPVTWMNATPPAVVDQWMAYEIVRNEAGQSDMDSPEAALEKLTKAFGNG